jgi:hypothetical protein
MNKNTVLISILLGLGIAQLLMSGCSFFSQGGSRPALATVYFDPRYSLQVETRLAAPEFQFDQGDLVEFRGLLIYHASPPEQIKDLLPSARWFGSLYPLGDWLPNETLRIQIRSQDARVGEEIEWQVDNDDFLLMLSDSPAHPHLVNSGEICVYLRLSELTWIDETDSSVLLLTLIPEGSTHVGLIRSEIYLCEQ